MKLISAVVKMTLISFCITSHAQPFLGYLSSNYSGVHGVMLQPASIVDSRYLVDINLVAANATILNNYIALKRSFIRDVRNDRDYDTKDFDEFKTRYLYEQQNADKKFLLVSQQTMGPSIMFPINEKNSLAFTSRFRTKIHVDNIAPALAKLMYEELNYPLLWNTSLENEAFSIQAMSWAEYGLTYGREIFTINDHYLKAAVSVKLLQGLGAAYLYVDNLNYNFLNDNILSLFNSQVSYGHSSSFEFDENNVNYRFVSNPTIGFDMGAVYEWRPNQEKYRYDMDGKTGLNRRDLNKYKIKVGFSLLDFGRMKFDKGDQSADFNADIDQYDISNFNIASVSEFNDSLAGLFGFNPLDEGEFNMNLPSAISFQIDYNIWKDFYVNFTPFIAIKRNKNDNKVRESTVFSIAPRYDYKWFGLGIPFSVNLDEGKNLGVNLRLGPLVVGTADFLSFGGKKRIFGANIFAAIRIPIPFGKPRDRDNDKVSNRMDKCKDIPGVWEFRGCPDTDGDGIPDHTDDCPGIAGPRENNGCPYPDTDGDGVLDKDDACIDVPGPLENAGCPWPDTDGDGIPDKDDACIDMPGPAENQGCPWPDTDGDGVLDKDDDCPHTPGPADNKGCPVLEEKEQEIIQTAFGHLEFENGKSVIKVSSYKTLEELGLLLITRPDAKLRIAGHTDEIGSEDFNMKLSRERALAVKKFLEENGVPGSRMIVEYYGETQPVADNNTDEGRAKNRRVELNIVFD